MATLLDLDDILTFLPTDKFQNLEIGDGDLVDRAVVDAERIVRAELGAIYTPVTLAGWASPDDTPEYVRSIAGRLAAAFIYRNRFSGDSDNIDPYAQNLYNEALLMIGQIKNGKVNVAEVTDTSTVLPDNRYFLPNDATTGPKFTVGMEF